MANKAPTFSVSDDSPAEFTPNQKWEANTGANPARALISLGSIDGDGKGSPGNLRHVRPYLVSGNEIFVFPVGMEGFTAAGQASLGIHRYIGGNAVVAQTIMREEGRITLTGTFPGNTAQKVMVACRNILRSNPPNVPGLIFNAPGVFNNEQYVTAESWEFTHSADDRTHSIDYTITLVRTGDGDKVEDPHGKVLVTNPTTTRRPSQSPAKTFTAKSGVQTLRQISKAVYGTVDDWQRLIQLNENLIGSFNGTSSVFRGNTVLANLPTYALPTYRFPIGTKFRY